MNDVPLSISAYSARELKYRQIETTDQLTNVTPNLQFSSHAPSSGHNSAAVVFIRGVGQPDFIPSSDPGVGLYVARLRYQLLRVGAMAMSPMPLPAKTLATMKALVFALLQIGILAMRLMRIGLLIQ